ncbi:MAG: translation initiation factor IF-6 [Promethearchaeati archaeon SRVP18_Atabeyarchaeia-1]
MSVERLDFLGNPSIGVYSLAGEACILVPLGLPAKTMRIMERVLNVKAIEAKICQTTLLGIMIVGNSNSMIVPYLASDDEIEFLQGSLGVKVSRLTTNLTALGNIILANDNGAIVHPKLREITMKSIESILGVKVVAGRIGGTGLVGSSAVATNKGALASPRATDEELDKISEVLGVPTSVGSVNRGVTYVRSGLIVNSHGAIAGRETTGPELDRIEEAFELI